MILEVIAFDFLSANLASMHGVDRLEICDNKLEGCTTRSIGLVRTIKESLAIQVFPMIRPRGGDFLYQRKEIDVMKYDIESFKDLGCEGVVLGCLDHSGNINSQYCKELIEAAYPMEVTFHRAFDRCKNPVESLKEIISLGFKRVLTSGQKPTALAGKEFIAELIEQFHKEITMIPGGGIDSTNIVAVCRHTKAKEIHSPAGLVKKSEMIFKNEGMNEELSSYMIDVEEIVKMKNLIKVLDKS